MSEPTDTILCMKTTINWMKYRQINRNCNTKNINNINNNNNNHKHQIFSLLYCQHRQNEKKLRLGRKQHYHRQFFIFPLGLQKFIRLRRNSHKTGHINARKPYFCSVKERSINEAGSNTGIDIYKFKQKMANTLSVMTNVLRNVVSKQRIRYKENGFNLDLAYVCDNIIAMGYPAEKYESMYRNRLEDVYKFLEENHRDHYKIYNLCLERSYDINKFHGRVSVYPFEDHNPPTIELIQQFCEDVDSWLKADAHNVAAVHCKAGKGRTGTMICCYLLYSGQQLTAEDALSCYDEKRTKDRKGVTIPSQRRYVQYFSKLIRLGLSYKRRTLQFCEMRFSEANILHSQGSVLCSISVLLDKVQLLQNFTIDFRKHCVLDMKTPPLSVAGDIKVELLKSTKKIFHFWFNTFFVMDSAVIEGEGNDEKYIYTLHKWEIDDAHKDKEHKYFSEDFKVELVFYVDENNVGRDNMKVSSSNSLANQRSTSQCAAASVRLPPTQSNNYSLPQNNSSGSEMNFICDQKSSSSTSVSSSLGGGTTDNSNGYESNPQRGPHLRICHPYMDMHDASSALFTTSPPPPPSLPLPAATITQTPPGCMMEHDELEHQVQLQEPQHQHQHKNNNVHHLQKTKGTSLTATSTPNQRHTQRQSAGLTVGGLQRTHAPSTVVMCQPSPNLNATSSNISYNHSTNSSKTSSVSSQSSSAIGDNEEDWESGESSAKQLEHITLLLSTSSVTTSPVPTELLSNNNTNTNLSLKDSLRSKLKINTGIQPPSPSSSSSTSTSITCTSSTQSHSPSLIYSNSSYSSSKCPNNKCNTSSSSCTNRVAGGDDDDDYDNVDDSKLKSKNPNSNIVVKQQHPAKTTSIKHVISKALESSKGNQQTHTVAEISDHDQNSTALALTTSAPPSTRPKLMHLLMAPKQNNAHQSSHKPIFKRKSSYKLMKNLSNDTGGHIASSDSAHECNVDAIQSETSTVDSVVGSFGGVATTSKQKLKIKLKKNKLKLSQKFQWFQSYFRSDPVDFCENFVQQTTSMRRNSICSMASRTHKLSTTTPPSLTPPPPPLAGVNDGSSSCEQLNDRGVASVSQSTSNASIATGDLCEDYYSNICDNQLSFSNSPCKSPRSMAEIASSISCGVIGGSFGSSFARSGGSSHHQQYFRERRETLPGASSHNARRNNVIIVAAKPARTNAIGFNVNTNMILDQPPPPPSTPLIRQDSSDVDASPASIYYTPSSASLPNDDTDDQHTTNTPFVFPQDQLINQTQLTESDDKTHELKQTNVYNCCGDDGIHGHTKAQTKYSLNLVIVKECPSEASANTNTTSIVNSQLSQNECDDDMDSVICCEHDQKGVSSLVHSLAEQEEEEAVVVEEGSTAVSSGLEEFLGTRMTATTACASVCSNSSSSGFCTSECCTTNSSSSSCNCNPFALVLERHAALAAINVKQQEQKQPQQQQAQDTIHEVIEKNGTDDTADTITSVTSKEVGDDCLNLQKQPESNDTKCDL